MISVFIVDDHRIVIDGIQSLLEGISHIKVVGNACYLSQARAMIKQLRPSILLQDISLKGDENGVSFTKEIKGLFPDLKVIALSMHNEPSLIKRMIKNGASGYLLKDAGMEELVNAIDKVDAGGNYYSPAVQETIMSSLSLDAKQIGELPKLSRREKEILALILKEMTTVEIAKVLFITPATVETHRGNMLNKLGVRNTAGLVRMCYEYNLIPNLQGGLGEK